MHYYNHTAVITMITVSDNYDVIMQNYNSHMIATCIIIIWNNEHIGVAYIITITIIIIIIIIIN